MEIRSVTLFCEPTFTRETAAAFFNQAREAWPRPVQTTRLATTPFPDWWDSSRDLKGAADEVTGQWQAAGVDYVSLGPVQLRHEVTWLDKLPELLAATGILFASVEIADMDGYLDVGRCAEVAAIIQQVSTILDNGFGNLYLAALANCPPGSPFFPVAYHGGGPPCFALALEAADLAVMAVESANSLPEARQTLITLIEEEAAVLAGVAQQLAAAHGIAFHGLDFSLAPYPTADKSLARAMEALGLPWIGAPGSLFTAAFITEAIGRATFPRCGFSGLMLSVLEDSVLAQRAGEGQVTVSDLLSYAAVCGVGLDTVPLPGNVSKESITGILLDVAALASRLNKPLTARLMPLPGLTAGDPVRFDFPYFADSRVMSVSQEGINRLLNQPANLQIKHLLPKK